jgi:hypothetical protein
LVAFVNIPVHKALLAEGVLIFWTKFEFKFESTFLSDFNRDIAKYVKYAAPIIFEPSKNKGELDTMKLRPINV